jgi:hypothetical protein
LEGCSVEFGDYERKGEEVVRLVKHIILQEDITKSNPKVFKK